ncbi:unnamed protein product [Schistosoma rodhaini]|uniref:LIM zinc-binding domain-containing protein n=1 Tax=Schistosoma rodhaini TaxID=6188 RepID=A0AA85GD33_9TREM|nr:unnamed protein product [Schistosoma rodhaini]
MKCPSCNKEVYFGSAKKTLTAGSHCEHDGKPYCQIPCYQALFGPKGYGSVASSHVYK